MLHPSRRIGTAELHEGPIFSTSLDLLTAIGLYISTCEKITRTKSHVYLELTAKRASVRTYINMHARKTHVLLYLFAKDTALVWEPTAIFPLNLALLY